MLETRSLRRRPRDGAANAQDSSKSRRCPPCFRHNGTALGPLDSVSSIFQSLKRRTWLSKLESYENQTKHHFLSSWHPRYLQEKSRETERRRLLAFGCPSADLQAAMESSVTCTVEPVQRTDRGSYAGQTTSFGDFLVVGGCAAYSGSVGMTFANVTHFSAKCSFFGLFVLRPPWASSYMVPLVALPGWVLVHLPGTKHFSLFVHSLHFFIL